MRSALFGLLLLLALPADAQIYKYLDANGNPVFSDQPPEGVSAEKIELPAPTIVTLPPLARRRRSSPRSPAKRFATSTSN